MNKLLIFSAGIIVGAGAAYAVLKNRFKKIADEEIASVKEAFSTRSESDEIILEHAAKLAEVCGGGSEIAIECLDRNIDIYEKKKLEPFSKRHTPRSYHNISGAEIVSPYIISPEEFGEFSDYSTINLTYYSDKVLTDDNNEPIENIEETIGADSLNHFGEYEDDSVFVRNDERRCDYEILLDLRKYSQVAKQMSPRKGG